MDKAMNALGFAATAVWFNLRDLLSRPADVLTEVGIMPGFQVLDYGCGPGSYSAAAAQLVGPTGKVYAVDINPTALQWVQRVAARKSLSNIETIHTDCATGLEDRCMDVVLLYDTYHDLADPDGVLAELHRILKPSSILSFTDHHMNDEEILEKVTEANLFRLTKKGRKTYTFSRMAQQ